MKFDPTTKLIRKKLNNLSIFYELNSSKPKWILGPYNEDDDSHFLLKITYTAVDTNIYSNLKHLC